MIKIYHLVFMIVCLNLDGVYKSKSLAVARKEKPDSGIWWGKVIKYFYKLCMRGVCTRLSLASGRPS